MPKDHWAAARAKDKGRKNAGRFEWQKQRTKKRNRKPQLRKTWFIAIADCTTEAELSAVARTLAEANKAHKMTADYYNKLVRAGQRKRRSLRTNSP